jgi:hypothetical protein
VTPLAANYAQAAREAYFAPYQMGKSAAVLADPRLLHPGLVERPQNIEESATRRGQHLNFAAGGATLGGLAGLAAAHALVRHVPDLAKELGAGTVRAGGGVAGLLGGAALGLGAGALTRAVSRVKKHDEAVHKFEQESGERIPFMARHPYLMTAGPSVLAAAYGLARPHAAVRELARHVGPGTGAGLRVLNAATNASLAGMTAGVLGNALSHNERKHFFQSRVPTLSMDRYGLTATEEVNTAKELEDMHRAMNGEAVEASEAI